MERNEQCRNDKHLKNHTNQHTADSTGSKRTVTVGAYTVGKHQRQQTDNHCEACHQDRTQTRCRTGDSGAHDAHTRLAAVKSELYDKDGVLCQQTDKHDQSDLQIDVVVDAKHLREEE